MGKTLTRFYLVTDGAHAQHLVEATNPQQALSHVARRTMTVEVAQQRTLVDMMKRGVEIEKATAPEQISIVNGNGADPSAEGAIAPPLSGRLATDLPAAE